MLCLIYVTEVVSIFIDISLHNAYYFSFLLIISFNLIIHFTLNNTTHYVKALESGKENLLLTDRNLKQNQAQSGVKGKMERVQTKRDRTKDTIYKRSQV